MVTVPRDVWLEIASNMDLTDFLSFLTVSRFHRSLGEHKAFWLDILYRYRNTHPVEYKLTLDLSRCDSSCLQGYVRDVSRKERMWSRPSIQLVGSTRSLRFAAHGVALQKTFHPIEGTPLLLVSSAGFVGGTLTCYRVDEDNTTTEVASLNVPISVVLAKEFTGEGCILYCSAVDEVAGIELRLSFGLYFSSVSMTCIPRNLIQDQGGLEGHTLGVVALNSAMIVWIYLHQTLPRAFLVCIDRLSGTSTEIPLHLPVMRMPQATFRGAGLYIIGFSALNGFNFMMCHVDPHFFRPSISGGDETLPVIQFNLYEAQSLSLEPLRSTERVSYRRFSVCPKTGVLHLVVFISALSATPLVRRLSWTWKLPYERPTASLTPTASFEAVCDDPAPMVPALTPHLTMYSALHKSQITSHQIIRTTIGGEPLSSQQVQLPSGLRRCEGIVLDESKGIVWYIDRSLGNIRLLRLH